MQVDELVTKLRGVKERVWVWVALDAHTTIIPVIPLGGRKAEDAQLFIHEIWQRLYYYALTAHFGQWVPHVGKRWPVWQVDPRLLFCRYHDALCLPTQHPHRYRSRTPAMASGLTRRRWRVMDILLMPLPLA